MGYRVLLSVTLTAVVNAVYPESVPLSYRLVVAGLIGACVGLFPSRVGGAS